MEKKRITYIDSAKAIAIILVIVGHCYWLKDIPKLGGIIYSFHMPLFFLISGFFIKDISIKDALSKYSKAYLWPYLVIGSFIIIIGIGKELYHSQSWYGLLSLNLVKILWGSNTENSDILFGAIPHIGPSWFLLALFWGCLSMSFIRLLKSNIYQITLIAIAISFSICSSQIIKMPFSLQGGVLCLTYIYTGNYIRKNDLLSIIFDIPTWIKILALSLWILVAIGIGGIDIGSGNLGYSVVGLTVSLIGSLFILYFCKRTNIKFGWIGRNTLSILCAHILIWRIFDIFDITVRKLTYSHYVNFIIEVLCEVFFALLLGWIISKVNILNFNKFKTKIRSIRTLLR